MRHIEESFEGKFPLVSWFCRVRHWWIRRLRRGTRL